MFVVRYMPPYTEFCNNIFKRFGKYFYLGYEMNSNDDVNNEILFDSISVLMG